MKVELKEWEAFDDLLLFVRAKLTDDDYDLVRSWIRFYFKKGCRDKALTECWSDEFFCVRKISQIMFSYWLARERVRDLLNTYIFTNPIYDREYKSCIFTLERLKTTIWTSWTPSGLGIFCKILEELYRKAYDILSNVIKTLNDWFVISKEALEYTLTKGERRFLNQLLWDRLYFPHLVVEVSYSGWVLTDFKVLDTREFDDNKPVRLPDLWNFVKWLDKVRGYMKKERSRIVYLDLSSLFT